MHFLCQSHKLFAKGYIFFRPFHSTAPRSSFTHFMFAENNFLIIYINSSPLPASFLYQISKRVSTASTRQNFVETGLLAPKMAYYNETSSSSTLVSLENLYGSKSFDTYPYAVHPSWQTNPTRRIHQTKMPRRAIDLFAGLKLKERVTTRRRRRSSAIVIPGKEIQRRRRRR